MGVGIFKNHVQEAVSLTVTLLVAVSLDDIATPMPPNDVAPAWPAKLNAAYHKSNQCGQESQNGRQDR
jgi:hypothetical protein